MEDNKTLEQYILDLEKKKQLENNEYNRLTNEFYGFSITSNINAPSKDPKMY